MKLRSKAGFTLVELIVVIAILAILAGVAVPVYSGYMTKAKEAADTQVTSALNTAFAAACTENGESNTSVEATVTVTSSKIAGIAVTKIDSLAVTPNANGTGDAKTAYDIQQSFLEYFGNNKDTVLGYYTGFTYSAGNFTGVKAS